VTVLLILMMLVVPLIFLWIGLLWKKHPPKKINWAYGYRTRRSSASQQAWDFAHAYFAKLARRLGMILLIAAMAAAAVALAVGSYEGLKTAALYSGLAQLAALWAPVFAVESRLRKEFDKDGRPKET